MNESDFDTKALILEMFLNWKKSFRVFLQSVSSCFECFSRDMSASKTTPKLLRLGWTDEPKSPMFFFIWGMLCCSGAIIKVSVLAEFNIKKLSFSQCLILLGQFIKVDSLNNSVGLKEQYNWMSSAYKWYETSWNWLIICLRGSIQKEKNRSQDRTPRNTTRKTCSMWHVLIYINTKTSTGKVDENYFRGDPDIPNRAWSCIILWSIILCLKVHICLVNGVKSSLPRNCLSILNLINLIYSIKRHQDSIVSVQMRPHLDSVESMCARCGKCLKLWSEVASKKNKGN